MSDAEQKQFEELSSIHIEGRALAMTRNDIAGDRESLFVKANECPYPDCSLQELAFMAGFASTMVGKLASLYFALIDKPKPTHDASTN